MAVRILRNDVLERCTRVDPSVVRSVTIDGLQPGPIKVEVLGFDADLDVIVDCQPPLLPSYRSALIPVTIVGGTNVNACAGAGTACDNGAVEVLAQPFVTHFDPLPGAVDVAAEGTASFAIVIDKTTQNLAIVQSSINVAVNGEDVVIGGVESADNVVRECDDSRFGERCNDTDKGASGFAIVLGVVQGLPAGQRVNVRVRAATVDGRSFPDFTYGFDTAAALPTVTPNETPSPAPTDTRTQQPTPTVTLTATPADTATPTPTETTTPTATETATETPTATTSATPTETATETPSATPTDTAT